MDVPIKVTYHIQLKSLVTLLFAGFLFLLAEGFVLSNAPTWSHWGLLLVGSPIFLFILGATFLTFIEINEDGIEKKYGLKRLSITSTKIPWTDIEYVTPYREDLLRQNSKKSSTRQTGITYKASKGKSIRIADLMNGAAEAFEYASKRISPGKIAPVLTKSQQPGKQ